MKKSKLLRLKAKTLEPRGLKVQQSRMGRRNVAVQPKKLQVRKIKKIKRRMICQRLRSF